VDNWADQIARRAAELSSQLGRGVTVGISGVDCSGKSTLAEAVRRRLEKQGLPAVLIEGDEFTRPTAERYGEEDEGLGYYRDSFDYDAVFEKVIPAVRASSPEPLRLDVSDWERDAWKETLVPLPPGAIVIVEGCFLFAAGRAVEFDLSVWIDLPLDEIVPPALSRPRDLERMGGADGVRERYEGRYIPGQRLHLERDRPEDRAALVLNVSPSER
jgi:uridine kinase